MMMGHRIDHMMISSLQADLEQKRQESAGRKKKEIHLYRLLAEMVETERKYVQDLEQTCRDYLPLAGSFDASQIASLDRRQLKKKTRNLSQCSSTNSSCGSRRSFNGLGLESGGEISKTE